MIRHISTACACLLCMLLLDAAQLHGQQSDYGGYTYDSTFFIGALDVNRTNLLPLVRDSLHVSLIHYYALPSHTDSAYAYQRLAQGDSGVLRMRMLVEEISNLGIKVSGPPGLMDHLGRSSRIMESYAGLNTHRIKMGNNGDSSSNATVDDDLYTRHFVWAHTVALDPGDTNQQHLMSSRPRFLNHALFRGDANFYSLLDEITPAADRGHPFAFYSSIADSSNPYGVLDEVLASGYNVSSKFAAIDSIVGWKNLLYNQEQMSVHDATQSFAEMPVLDTVITRRAQRYARGAGGAYLDSTGSSQYDPRTETFIEVTHYRPGSDDSLGYHTGSRSPSQRLRSTGASAAPTSW